MTPALTDAMVDGRITAEEARERFHYDAETGVLTWKSRSVPRSRVRVGGVAGCSDKDGYRIVKVNNRNCKVHRLIWLMVTGEWPKFEIDHINGNASDNRFTNLRDVPHSINTQNLQRARKDNKLGLLGVVRKSSGKFEAQINSGGIVHIGTFPTAEQAHTAYVETKRVMHAGNTL